MTAPPPPVLPDERLTEHVSVRARSHVTDPEGAPIAVVRRISELLDPLPSAWAPYTSHSSS
ncbi:hypothetical protein ACFWWC_46785 [Streptomyces sp. NPDC058642]|uniref:hypothetical protein n=1 Tax=Streptomyces sp. NPDC058642 TaxID=3346572 RepID=UPI0036681021